MPIFSGGGSMVGTSQIVDGAVVDSKVGANANIDPAKLGAGPWDVLANVVLGGAAAEITSGTILAREQLKVLLYVPSFTTVSDVFVRYNNDTAANYNYNTESDVNGLVTAVGQTSTRFQSNGALGAAFLSVEILNITTLPKMHTGYGNQDRSMIKSAGSWSNIIAQITEIDIFSTNNLPTGTRMIVLGRKLT
jgi:hypothetical protein